MVEQICERLAHHFIGQPSPQQPAGLVTGRQVAAFKGPNWGCKPEPQKIPSAASTFNRQAV